MFVDAFSDVETTLTLEEQQQLEQYMDDFDIDGWSWNIEYGSNEGGLIGRLSSIQDRASNIAKLWDIQMIASALEIYNLDEDTYPIYETFVEVSQLSWYLMDYLISMPTMEWAAAYYKTIGTDQWFVMMVELSPGSEDVNFFWSQWDLQNKSLQEIQDIIANPTPSDWRNRYVVVNG